MSFENSLLTKDELKRALLLLRKKRVFLPRYNDKTDLITSSTVANNPINVIWTLSVESAKCNRFKT
jgi:hypothetical protein